MARLVIVLICLTLAIAFGGVESSAKALSSNIDVTVVDDLAEYLDANPDVKLLEPLTKQISVAAPKEGPSPRFGITYKSGKRINGDSLQGFAKKNFDYTTPQEIKVTVQYPGSGVGAVISYVQIDVEQSTNLGQAYITDGGVGQRKLTIVIEAKQTLYFKYKAYIWGY